MAGVALRDMAPPLPSTRKSSNITVVGRSTLQANWTPTVRPTETQWKSMHFYMAGTALRDMPPPPPSGRKSCHVTVVGRSGLQANWPTTVEHEFARGKHAFLYGRAGTSEHATVTAVGHFYIASGSG